MKPHTFTRKWSSWHTEPVGGRACCTMGWRRSLAAWPAGWWPCSRLGQKRPDRFRRHANPRPERQGDEGRTDGKPYVECSGRGSGWWSLGTCRPRLCRRRRRYRRWPWPDQLTNQWSWRPGRTASEQRCPGCRSEGSGGSSDWPCGRCGSRRQ